MHYVYVLRSRRNPVKTYVGLTCDPDRRIAEHNAGESTYTAKWAPWDIVVLIGFAAPAKAESFERYLKEGSGHAFAQRHFW